MESTPAVEPASLKHGQSCQSLTPRTPGPWDLHVAGERLVVTEGGEDLGVREYLGQRLQHSPGSVQIVLPRLQPDVVRRVVSSDHDELQGGAVLLLDVLQHLQHGNSERTEVTGGVGGEGGDGTLV